MKVVKLAGKCFKSRRNSRSAARSSIGSRGRPRIREDEDDTVANITADIGLISLNDCLDWLELSPEFLFREIDYYTRSVARTLSISTLTDNIDVSETFQAQLTNMLKEHTDSISKFRAVPEHGSESTRSPPEWLQISGHTLVLKTIVVRFSIGNAIESKFCEDLELLARAAKRIGLDRTGQRLQRPDGLRIERPGSSSNIY